MAVYQGLFDGVLRDLTDDEVVQRMAQHLIFTADKVQVPADGKTRVTITLQLASLPLSDGKRREIHEVRENIGIYADGEHSYVALDKNGRAQLTFAFDTAGEYEFKSDGVLYSEPLIIEAV